MSIFMGIVVGLLFCWLGKKKLDMENAAVYRVAAAQEKLVAKKPIANRQEPKKKTESKAAKPARAAKKKISGTAKKKAVSASVRKSTTKLTKKDDLKKIGGIGPKIAEILNNDGVITFKQLSKTKPNELKKILDNAGSRYRASDLSAWSKQAKFADKGDWDGAKAAWENHQSSR